MAAGRHHHYHHESFPSVTPPQHIPATPFGSLHVPLAALLTLTPALHSPPSPPPQSSPPRVTAFMVAPESDKQQLLMSRIPI
ncbi:hypothetical protein E2C01_039828 [Portunus trituberculatus]|uniref:Uncharacterized protein n=1 Tax=Portunus trituberculatus TaxID=210409 RepID=A0A5B7FLQ6_PORTR|nr:hypothetical protein [Portunus trituberculatus]